MDLCIYSRSGPREEMLHELAPPACRHRHLPDMALMVRRCTTMRRQKKKQKAPFLKTTQCY